MNLALGAFGGLVAITFVALMELYGVPPLLRWLSDLAIGTVAGMASGCDDCGAQLAIGFHHHACRFTDFRNRPQPPHYRAQPFYGGRCPVTLAISP